ncbi:HD domain-containing protein [Fodinicola feengrottensis]|uniref:HD domain-containing protein n=1 Tax=Fodinicola feengrottensis TaxID=435914 RepID=UPI002442FC61|nr:metal-dependent phosphohydrolase [Fodinicola feengrottensis]
MLPPEYVIVTGSDELTTDVRDDLLARWPLDERLGRHLLDRWREPHRRYHTVDHLAAVLDTVDRYAPAASDPEAVRLAAWFHDAVYLPQRNDNEEASATLARRNPFPARNRAATARRNPPVDPADPRARGRAGRCERRSALRRRPDLLILASPPDLYATYVMAVRKEYSHVPEPDFVAGRSDVLRGILQLPRIFLLMPAKCEDAARANLIAELDSY